MCSYYNIYIVVKIIFMYVVHPNMKCLNYV